MNYYFDPLIGVYECINRSSNYHPNHEQVTKHPSKP